MNFLSLTGIEFRKIKRSKILFILLVATVILWIPSILNAHMNFSSRSIADKCAHFNMSKSASEVIPSAQPTSRIFLAFLASARVSKKFKVSSEAVGTSRSCAYLRNFAHRSETRSLFSPAVLLIRSGADVSRCA